MSSSYKIEKKFVKEIIESELSLIGISEFFIQNRLKSERSIEKKKLRKDKLGNFKEISGYSGIRIIVNKLGDLRKCIEFISSRFKIDYKNSNFNPLSFTEDKEFGYQSSHIVIITNELKTEIQIRTLAQHIWATIIKTWPMGAYFL
jgi:ppGpp synthetase/RelA/SpoT-type nucleotidyltranferase